MIQVLSQMHLRKTPYWLIHKKKHKHFLMQQEYILLGITKKELLGETYNTQMLRVVSLWNNHTGPLFQVYSSDWQGSKMLQACSTCALQFFSFPCSGSQSPTPSSWAYPGDEGLQLEGNIKWTNQGHWVRFLKYHFVQI